MTLEEIADMLEEDLETVQCIAGELQEEENKGRPFRTGATF